MPPLATVLNNTVVLNIDVLESEYRDYAVKFPVSKMVSAQFLHIFFTHIMISLQEENTEMVRYSCQSSTTNLINPAPIDSCHKVKEDCDADSVAHQERRRSRRSRKH
jgi:hypothetical protein